jgi:CRISPR-associated protein Csc1
MKKRNKLNIASSLKESACRFSQYVRKAYWLELTAMELIYFASKEVSNYYLTEGIIDNYALAYAFQWCKSPYRLSRQDNHKPRYLEDFASLVQEQYAYILPAWPKEESVKYITQSYNCLSDSYWYGIMPNRLATDRKAYAQGKKTHRSFRPANFPQYGQIRLIAQDNVFHSIAFGNHYIPNYCRIGKFMSKVKVEILTELDIIAMPYGKYTANVLLNTADLPREIEVLSYNLITILPVSLMKNLLFEGNAWQVGNFVMPAGLGFCAW